MMVGHSEYQLHPILSTRNRFKAQNIYESPTKLDVEKSRGAKLNCSEKSWDTTSNPKPQPAFVSLVKFCQNAKLEINIAKNELNIKIGFSN